MELLMALGAEKIEVGCQEQNGLYVGKLKVSNPAGYWTETSKTIRINRNDAIADAKAMADEIIPASEFKK